MTMPPSPRLTVLDLQLPDVAIDFTDAPNNPVERDDWIRRREIDLIAEAFRLDPSSHHVRSMIGQLLTFRRQRDESMAQARAAWAANDPEQVQRWVRVAHGRHVVVLRRLRVLRRLAWPGQTVKATKGA